MRVALPQMLVAIAVLLPAHGASAEDLDWKSCREGWRRVSNLEAANVSCDTARWVARRFDHKTIEEGHWPGGSISVGRFECHSRNTGYETYRIRCDRPDGAIVRFDWGV